jgi:hypothetical protein
MDTHQKTRGKQVRYVLLGLALLLLTVMASGAETRQLAPAEPGTVLPAAKKATTAQQLDDLVKSLTAARADLKGMRKKAGTTRDESEKKLLDAEIDSLSKSVDELLASLETIVTGGSSLALDGAQPGEVFDWKQEIEDLLKPFVYELKRLTERPRRIELLRSQQTLYEDRLGAAEDTLEKIVTLRADAQTPALQQELGAIEQRWRKRREELNNKLTVTTLELEDLFAPRDEDTVSFWETTRELFSGRGLNLILAIAAFAVTYLLLHQTHRVYDRYTGRRARGSREFATRMVSLLFSTLTFLMALLAAMVLLSVRGDWLLLGLIIIVLVASILALRHSLPQYAREARTLLNIGPVREGERVVYQGLPWKVASLNVYSTLINPALRGGRLRLSLNEVATLHSRQYEEGEAWFPTQQEDYVLLDDTTFGRVLQQTPEYVQLAVAGSIKTYSVGAFLGTNPRNLSADGFGMFVTLGLDYRYQPQITTTIRDQVEAFFRQGLEAHAYGEHLKNVVVEFNEAGASSLDIAVIGVFSGGAAADYFAVRRLMNKLAVDVCNAHNWVIPFNQISVHMETPVQLSPAAGTPQLAGS